MLLGGAVPRRGGLLKQIGVGVPYPNISQHIRTYPSISEPLKVTTSVIKKSNNAPLSRADLCFQWRKVLLLHLHFFHQPRWGWNVLDHIWLMVSTYIPLWKMIEFVTNYESQSGLWHSQHMEKLDSKPISCKMFVSNQFGVFMMPPYHPGSPSGEGAGRTKKVKINCICKQICVA